jgi:hypothetical protein
MPWGDENSHIGALDFYPIFIPLFERKVSGVSVQRSRWPEKRPVKSKKKFWPWLVSY